MASFVMDSSGPSGCSPRSHSPALLTLAGVCCFMVPGSSICNFFLRLLEVIQCSHLTGGDAGTEAGTPAEMDRARTLVLPRGNLTAPDQLEERNECRDDQRAIDEIIEQRNKLNPSVICERGQDARYTLRDWDVAQRDRAWCAVGQ